MRTRLPRLHFVLLLATLAALFAPAAVGAIIWNKVYTGFSSPVEIAQAHDGSGRLFVVQQDGAIRIVKNGLVLETPFIDLGGPAGVTAAGGEQGLLGLAFHPQFAANRQFYVDYTRKSDGATVIARYTASAGNPDIADLASATILLTIAQPESNHNGGAVKFGPDGFLYIGMGDGGGANDQHGTGNAQDKTSLLGKILRVDVDGGSPYAIPPGNPFASGVGGRPEIFALGMRNPWRFSFDRMTGDFWIGDVGQNAVEEVDRLAAGSGAGTNFGWRIMEGDACTGLGGPYPCGDAALTPPVLAYTHSFGCSITGGYVYRGSGVPEMFGQYLYADYCSGRIWAAQGAGAGPWLSAELGATGYAITTFGEDEAGELYFANYTTGDIYRFATDTSTVNVIEFYHAALDHYFMSSLAADIAALDSGKFKGWARTGKTFKAYPSPQPGASPVCRFYLPPAAGDSHFFSASIAECGDVLARFPAFVYESPAAMYEFLPDAGTGACPQNAVPVYRMWNQRADSNHRYTTDRALRDAMVAQGYVAEGYGPDVVAMCAPP